MEKYTPLSGETLQDIISFIRDITRKRTKDISEVGELQKIRGFSSGLIHATKQVTAAYSAGQTDLYLDAVGGAGGITITLHASPGDGWRHEIWKKDAGVGAITIAGNGKNINGSGSISLAAQYDFAVLVYMAAAGEWRRR